MKLAEELAEAAVVEFAPKKEGRSMTMVLGPTVKKTQQRNSAKKTPAVPVKNEKNEKQVIAQEAEKAVQEAQ